MTEVASKSWWDAKCPSELSLTNVALPPGSSDHFGPTLPFIAVLVDFKILSGFQYARVLLSELLQKTIGTFFHPFIPFIPFHPFTLFLVVFVV